jgi:uncharacterized protein
MKKPLMIILLIAIAAAVGAGAAPSAVPADPAADSGVPGEGARGFWLGSLQVGGMTLRLGLEVTEADGRLSAVLDSIDQNAKLPVTTIESDAQGVRFTVTNINGRFEGKFSANGAQLVGTWSQGPGSLPLTFKRLAQPFALARPQEPAKPYPYREQTVSIRNEKAGVMLAGTLTIPQGKGPFPAVVLMSGSGPQDRDEALMGHKPFLVLADHLTRSGIAVLRYDDRGFGKSTGNYAAATHLDFAADGRAAFDFLKARPEVDAKRVGLLGHSEGSVYAPFIAKEAPDVAFVVLLAGVGVPMSELLERQGMDMAAAMGIKYQISAEERAINAAVAAKLAEGKFDEETVNFIRAKMREALALYPDDLKKALGLNEGMIEARVRMVASPWFATLLRYDAGQELPHIQSPVLGLFGGKDLQVAAAPNAAGMKAAFDAAGNRKVTLKTFAGLNHLFQHAKTGAPGEYGTIEETMAPEVLETVATWINKQH